MRKHLSFFIYFLLAIILLFGNKDQRLSKANFLSSTIFLPFINTVNRIESLFEIDQQNKKLALELAKKTLEMGLLEDKIRNLQTTQINFDILNQEYILGDIISYAGRFKDQNLIINKGRLDKVKKNYPVLSNDGIVGKIIEVSLNYSVVLPLNHHQFKLGVMVKRNRLQGLLASDIYGNTFMTMIKPGSDIKLGDEIITSNISSVFPKNYPVGKVVKLIESPDKLFMKAELSTYVDPAMMDQVIIQFFEKDKSYEQELNNN